MTGSAPVGKIAVSALALVVVGCTGSPNQASETVQALPTPQPSAVATPAPSPAPAAPQGPTTFLYSGELTQGGWIRGQAPGGTSSASLDGQALALDEEGRFFAAFDRDAGAQAQLVAQVKGGRTITSPIAISPRAWNIERVNVAMRPGSSSEAFLAKRRPELAAIGAARAKVTGAAGWAQDFVWPVKGRISGRFGSQRIYRGEPGSYHSGIDISTGTSGTPFVSPADGVVVLAVEGFTLEGNLLIIDHGQGLNSAFLHASRLVVKEGDVVKRGQHVGDIGMSGRATGPHLHWGLKWHGARLDPLLFTGPMN